MKKYHYSGTVRVYDTLAAPNWQADTMAESERRAKTNFRFQFAKQAGYDIRHVRIALEGKIEEVEE